MHSPWWVLLLWAEGVWPGAEEETEQVPPPPTTRAKVRLEIKKPGSPTAKSNLQRTAINTLTSLVLRAFFSLEGVEKLKSQGWSYPHLWHKLEGQGFCLLEPQGAQKVKDSFVGTVNN